MSAQRLLDELRNQGIVIRLDGADLDVEGPLELIDDPATIEGIRQHKPAIVALLRQRQTMREPVELVEYETSVDTEWHDNATKSWFSIPAGTPCALVEDLDAEEPDPWGRSILRRRMQSAKEHGEQVRLVRLQRNVCLLNCDQVRLTLASITKCLMAQAATSVSTAAGEGYRR